MSKAEKLWGLYQLQRNAVKEAQERRAQRLQMSEDLLTQLEQLQAEEHADIDRIKKARKEMLSIVAELPGLMSSEVAGQTSDGALEDRIPSLRVVDGEGES